MQHGESMNGAQAVWWLSPRDAKSRSLWAPTKGKCSVNEHCYISKCALLQSSNYGIERSSRGGILRQISHERWESKVSVRLHRSADSHSGLIPCSGGNNAQRWPAYAELFPSKKGKADYNATRNSRNASLRGSAAVWVFASLSYREGAGSKGLWDYKAALLVCHWLATNLHCLTFDAFISKSRQLW